MEFIPFTITGIVGMGMSSRLLFSEAAATSILSCALITILYVGSLYAWSFVSGKGMTEERDDPAVIKRRFMGVALASIIAVMIVDRNRERYNTARSNYSSATRSSAAKTSGGGSLAYDLGFRSDNLLQASLLPVAVTALPFAGPLLMDLIDWVNDLKWKVYIQGIPISAALSLEAHRFMSGLMDMAADLIYWRNLVVAPIGEELVFRACNCRLLLYGGFRRSWVIFFSPLFFGAAHLHHFANIVYRQRRPFGHGIVTVGVQMCYTTVFGWYAAFLFLLTGHLISPVLVHSFCNYMGLPNVMRMMEHHHCRLIGLLAIAGVVAFLIVMINIIISPGSYSLGRETDVHII